MVVALLDSHDVVLNLVAGRFGIGDLEVDHSVDGDHQVVLGDDRLRRKGDHLLTHVQQRQQAVDERHQQGEPRSLGALVLAEALHDSRTRLGDDPYALRQDHHDEGDQRQKYNYEHEIRHCFQFPFFWCVVDELS